jgi:short-subunit dehydrogenase
VNNAGLVGEGPYVSVPWEETRKVIEVNLIAPMELTYLVLPLMIAKKMGHIVNIASTAGKCGVNFQSAYAGTKAGMAEWAHALNLELADAGVHFSTIFPGYITGVGMFAETGLTAPKTVGCCTPAQVAQAVVKAIEHNKLEIIVNSVNPRFFNALKEISPEFWDWLLVKSGVVDFQRKIAGLWDKTH